MSRHDPDKESAQQMQAESQGNAGRESKEHFRGFFDNTVIGLYRTAPDGRILLVNPAIVHMLGYSSFEELAQRNLEEGEYEPRYLRSAFRQRVDSEGQVVGLESAWTRRDGTTLFVRESARAVCDEAGNTLYYEETRRIIDKLNTVVVEALTEANIEMPYPQLDVHLTHQQPNPIDSERISSQSGDG